MRSVLRAVARLYPRAWRERYGEEFEALLEDRPVSARDALDVFRGALKMQLMTWNSVKLVLACMLVGTLAAVAFSFARPTLYRSQTLITVQSSDPRPLDHQLADLIPGMLTQQTAIEIIEKENLYPAERARMPMSAVVDLMQKNLRILPLFTAQGKPAKGFVVQFSSPDPRIAQRVDADLVQHMVSANLATAAAATTDLLKERLAHLNNPETKARLQSILQEAQTAQNARDQQQGARSRWMVFSVLNAPDLPHKPFYPNRPFFGAGGLLAGLFGGLMLAWVMRLRQKSATANG